MRSRRYPRFVTAQEAYRSLLKEHVGPPLRASGWRGSAAVWYLPSDTHHAILGWQKDRRSDAEQVSFTANVKVVAKSVWFAQNHPPGRLDIGKRPEANASYGLHDGVTWERRVGQLMGVRGGDHWWRLHAKDDLAVLAHDVLTVVEGTVEPAVREEVAAQRHATPLCEYNVGLRNMYRRCGGRPEAALDMKERRAFLCSQHLAEVQAVHERRVLGEFPDLM